MPVLHVMINDFCQIHPLHEGKPVVVGRAPECDIVLSSPAVSRRHAVIVYKNGICGIKDLQSFNGTLLNDEPITRPRRFTSRDTVRISSFSITIVYENQAMPGGPLPAVEHPGAGSASGPGEILDTQAAPFRVTSRPPESGSPTARPDGMDDSEFAERSGVDTSLFDIVPEDKLTSPSGPFPAITPEMAEKLIPLGEPDMEENLTLAEEDGDENLDGEAATGSADAAEEEEPPEPLRPGLDEDQPADEVEPAPPSGATRFLVGLTRVGQGKIGEAGAGLATIPIAPALREIMESRIAMHSALVDLSEERKLFRMAHKNRSGPVESELARQDEELDTLPTADEAEGKLLEMRETHQLQDAAREQGGDVEPILRAAEEMAINQWLLIRDSNRELLPAIYKEAYRLAADEPLAEALNEAGISHARLLGGAVYVLALERYARDAETARRKFLGEIRVVAERGTEKSRGNLLSKFGKLGQLASNFQNRQEIRDEQERLEDEARTSALRIEMAMREMHFMERILIREYRWVYRNAALHFIPRYETMPVAVRAFLRHGVIGMKGWWMRPASRDAILHDCETNVLQSFERDSRSLPVLYADEYMAAVANMECSPSPNEKLETQERSSVEWKTDRAFRRIVNSRMYNVLLEETLVGLARRRDELDEQYQEMELQIAAMKEKPFTGKDRLFDLQTEIQAIAIRKGNLEKHIKRIEEGVVSSILDAIEESEGRFRRGDLRLPSHQSLVRREVDCFAEFASHMLDLREGFIPMLLREHADLDDGSYNDRETIRKRIAEMERADPGIFVTTIIPSRKRENRVDLRLPPTIIIVPAVGFNCICSMGREGMEGGHLVVPSCFARQDIRDRQLNNLLADFRWISSRNYAGRDLMNSDTLAGEFMRLRWKWRNFPKPKREKGMVFNENTDAMNWRKVYELYLSDAKNGARQLYLRNPEMYHALIGKFIELPEGLAPLKKN